MKTLSKLTNAEKIEILEETKRIIQENGGLICITIMGIIKKKYSLDALCIETQESFLMNKNEARAKFNASFSSWAYLGWWEGGNNEDRIKYIDHLISKLQNHD